MRTFTMVALLIAVTLSGCAGDDGTTTEPTDGTTPVQGDDDNSTQAPDTPTGSDANETVENLVPVLTFSADVVNGTAPLLVNFTIDVDDDSEEFAWSFFVEGNETLSGTDVPATFNHTFSEGVFNVTATITDGEHTVDDTFVIEAATAVPAAPEPICGDDAADRGGTPADIVGVCVLIDDVNGFVIYTIELAAATGIDGCSEYPFTWGVYPGGGGDPIEVYCFLGLGVANWAGGQNFDTAATVALDGSSLVITVPSAELEGIDVTTVYGETWNGPGGYGGRPMWIPGSIAGESIAFDRAPDSGAYGP